MNSPNETPEALQNLCDSIASKRTKLQAFLSIKYNTFKVRNLGDCMSGKFELVEQRGGKTFSHFTDIFGETAGNRTLRSLEKDANRSFFYRLYDSTGFEKNKNMNAILYNTYDYLVNFNYKETQEGTISYSMDFSGNTTLANIKIVNVEYGKSGIYVNICGSDGAYIEDEQKKLQALESIDSYLQSLFDNTGITSKKTGLHADIGETLGSKSA